MTHLVFTGIRNGQLVRVVWEDGALSGDPETIAWIQHYAALLEGVIVGMVGGPYSSSHHLADPYAAAELIRSVFPGEVTMEGELPLRIAPPGAIQ
jgi:hypothetical protein